MDVQCRSLTVSTEGLHLLAPLSIVLSGPSLVALTGANGTGKTTLLKVLAARLRPSSGHCEIRAPSTGYCGAPDEFAPGFRATTGSLIDTPPMARDMTVSEQLSLVSASWGHAPEQAEEQGQRLLERLTIPELDSRFPHELSAGQLQLFALGLTLIRPAELLLLDEPERHLDEHRVQAVLELLQDRARKGALVITATHRRELVSGSERTLNLDSPGDR